VTTRQIEAPFYTLKPDDEVDDYGTLCNACALVVFNFAIMASNSGDPVRDMDEAHGVLTLYLSLAGDFEELLIPLEHGTCKQCGRTG